MNHFANLNFSKLNLDNFNSLICVDNEILPGYEFIKYFGLIQVPKSHPCVHHPCDGLLLLEKKDDYKLKHRYRCAKCLQTLNPAQHTWFSNSRLTIIQSLKVIYCWVLGLPSTKTATALGLNKNTVSAYYSLIRQLCINKCDFDPIKIGGEGHIVELDETKVYHRKYNRGRMLFNEKSKSWVLGGVDRQTNQCFAVLVENRNSNTIKEIITKKVLKGTRLVTDKWKAYCCLRNCGYTVDQVNHSKNFVDPVDPTINTQKIERAWGSLKTIMPKSAHGEGKNTYIEEFVYRKTYFTDNVGQNFKLFLNDLKSFYPGCFLFE